MFVIGAKVVHPCYGAGVVASIQRKAIGEDAHAYYVIQTVARSMQLMVPVERAEELRLRRVGKARELRDSLSICSEPPSEEEIVRDLRPRQALMREKLKSGSFAEVAQVARQLYYMNHQRPLGTVDRQMLEQGKEFLAGELALACGMPIEEAMQEVEDTLKSMIPSDDEQA